MTQELATRLQERLDPLLHVVIRYCAASHSVTSLTPRADDLLPADRISNVVREAQLQGIEQSHLERLYSDGPLQCTLRVLTDAFVWHFRVADNQGLLLYVEPSHGIDVTTFVSETLRCLDAHYDHSISIPEWA